MYRPNVLSSFSWVETHQWQIIVTEASDLDVDRNSLDFDYNDSSKYFYVENDGGGTLNYTITDNVDWLTYSSTSGSTSSSTNITVYLNRSAMGWGNNQTATITVKNNDDSGDYETIAVTADNPDPDPVASRVTPSVSSVTLSYGANQKFTVSGEDDGGDLDHVVWTLSGAETDTDTDSVGFGGSSDTTDFKDAGDYTFNTPGDYTLRARVYDESGDYDDAVWSIHVNDPPQPDLIISSLTLSQASGYPGQRVDVNSITKNTGDADTGWNEWCKVRYYLGRSSGEQWREIGWGWTPNLQEVNGIAVNEEEPDGISWTVDADLTPGRYYITAVADADDDIDESDESDSRTVTFDVTAVPQPDLIISSLTLSQANGYPGQSVDVNSTTKNDGNADTGLNTWCKVRYYLGRSSGELWREIGWGWTPNLQEVNGIAVNEEEPDGISWTIDADLTPGRYYITAVADADDDIDESDESDNRTVTFDVTAPLEPDLIGGGGYPSQTYFPGDTVEFSFAVRNDGNAPSSAGKVDFFAHKDIASYADGDRFTSTSYGTLGADGGQQSQNFDWTIPAGATPGTYAVTYWVDVNNTSDESNEDNNKGEWIVTVRRKPDIAISSSTPPDLSDKNYLPHLVDVDGSDDKYDPFIDWDADGEKDSDWTAHSSRCFGPDDTVAIHVMVESSVAATRTARVKAYYNKSSPDESGRLFIGQTTASIPVVEGTYNGLPITLPGSRNLIVEWLPPTIGQYYIQVELEEYINEAWVPVGSEWIDGSVDGIAASPMLVTDEKPIILVHGWSGQGSNFGELELLLELTYNRPVRKFEYETAKVDVGPETYKYPRVDVEVSGKVTLIEQLADFVAAPNGPGSQGFDSFDAIAHSYGGLIVRRYALEAYSKLARLITLGTPHYGGNAADAVSFVLNNQAHDLEFGSPLQWRIFSGWASLTTLPDTLAIVGTDNAAWGNYNTSDGIVRCSSASVENLGCPVYYVPHAHSNGLVVGGISPGMAVIEDREHESWAPIRHFFDPDGHVYPYKNGGVAEPGNAGGEDDIGNNTHEKALESAIVWVVAQDGGPVALLQLNLDDVIWNKNVVDYHYKGINRDSGIYFVGGRKADGDDTSGSENFANYQIDVTLAGQPTSSDSFQLKAGETFVSVIDFSDAPDTPTPIAPLDDVVLTSLTPTLQWSAFNSSTAGRTQAGFEVRVRCDTDGDTIVYSNYVASTSGSSHTIPNGTLEHNKHYHWHVRYKDNTGVWSAWSADDPNPHQDFYTVEGGAFVIYSEHGNPNPAPGSYPWVSGQTMTGGSVVSPADQSDGTRWLCMGYFGTGSAPTGSGTSYPSFEIYEDSTLHWNWQAQHQVTPETGGNGTISPSSSSWEDEGTEVIFTAEAGSGYTVDRWFVNGAIVQHGGTIYAQSNISRPLTVQVTFRWTGPTNTAPEITEGASVNVTMSQDGNPTPFALTLHATDAEGDTVYWNIVSYPEHGLANVTGTGTSKSISYTPQTGYFGSDNFIVQIDDGRGLSDTITVNVQIESLPDNTAPTVPSLNQPSDETEVTSITPTLSVNNASDAEGDTITYGFELYSDASLAGLVSSADVGEGNGVTAWTVDVELADHATYYWRCLAYDSENSSDYMETAQFFVNTANEAPGAPVASKPEDGSSVAMLQPTLTVSNADNADQDALTYEYEVYSDDSTLVLAALTDGILEGSVETSWQVDTELDDNTWYWWQARARDDEALAGDWSDLQSVFINTANDAPAGLTISSPQDGEEMSSLDVNLMVNNAVDPEGKLVTYNYQIDKVSTFNGADLQEIIELEEGNGGETSWSLLGLSDNTLYHWRARAYDGEVYGEWAAGSFFLNVSNDMPTAPGISSPGDGSQVTSTAPTLSVTPAFDPDMDTLTYTFEVYSDETLTSLVVSESDFEVAIWQTVGVLDNHATYYWRACAIDEHGTQGPWSETAMFTVSVAPGAPMINSPSNGGVVDEGIPTLSVINGQAAGDEPLTYSFEIYADENLTELVDSEGGVSEGDTLTSYTVTPTLENEATYYWRVKASDGVLESSWTSTAAFLVLMDNYEVEKEVVAWSDFSAGSSETQTTTVVDTGSDLANTSVIIPVGALTEDSTIIISEVNNPPAVPEGIVGIGIPVDFGPDGLQFNKPVTIQIPYSQALMDAAGISDPNDLEVWTYSAALNEWEEIEKDSVDIGNKVVVCKTTHFSIYRIAASVSAVDHPKNTGGGGGGGGGGVFGAVSINDVIGYHLDAIRKDGTRIYMPVTKGYKALKGAQTHIEGLSHALANMIRGVFESLERRAEANKDGMLYWIGTHSYPILGKIAELYLRAFGAEDLMTAAYSDTIISATEFDSQRSQGIAICPHVVKDAN